MKLHPNRYLICSLGENGRLVAIDEENRKVLAHYLSESGTIEKVPDDKTVRGIFVKISDDGFLESVDETLQQNDITINQLKMPVSS